jgi:ferritin-like protein
MEATAPGQNRTGAAITPDQINLMLEAVRELSPPVPVSTLRIDEERQSYITEAESVGSIPPPKSAGKGTLQRAKAKLKGASPSLLLDKLGERIAFERTGARLYDALISKYLALRNSGEDPLPPADSLRDDAMSLTREIPAGEAALDTLRRIRLEELRHFQMLCDTVASLGGDPTAQTPCADVTAAASMGLMQVLTDPRTTVAQCLNTLLTAELTDNAGWELLSELAQKGGQSELVDQFSEALEEEQQHLAIIRGWLKELLSKEAGTHAV